MGLDMYLRAYHKAQLEKTVFNAEESEVLKDWNSDYNIFEKCPEVFVGIATEIRLINEYYDMEKISRDFADGQPLTIGCMGGGKIGFRNYEQHIKIDLDADMIHKNYILQKEETAYIVQGNYEIAYWRKANQIRQWFVNHIEEFNVNDNGDYYRVTKELLEKLIEDCKVVLEDHDMASVIMPSSSGFFFGNTDYDEWYFRDLESTIEKCQNVIDETDWENEVVVYTESW